MWCYLLSHRRHNVESLLPLCLQPKIALIGPMTNATWMYNRYGYHPKPSTPLWVSVEEALAERIGAAHVSNTAGVSA